MNGLTYTVEVEALVRDQGGGESGLTFEEAMKSVADAYLENPNTLYVCVYPETENGFNYVTGFHDRVEQNERIRRLFDELTEAVKTGDSVVIEDTLDDLVDLTAEIAKEGGA